MPDVSTGQEILMLRPDVVVTTLESEAVFLDLETKYFYSTNLSGWAITQLFECGATRAQVEEQCRSWAVTEEQKTVVAGFVQYLISERLIAPSRSPRPQAAVELPTQWETPKIEKYKEPLQRIMISAFDPTLPLAE